MCRSEKLSFAVSALRAMYLRPDVTISFKNGQLAIDDTPIESCPVGPLESRVEALAHGLNLGTSDPDRIAAWLYDFMSRGRVRRSDMLAALGAPPADGRMEEELIASWKVRLGMRIEALLRQRKLRADRTDDHYVKDLGVLDHLPEFINALPRVVLKDCSTILAPVPGMPDLPMTEAWVDLRVAPQTSSDELRLRSASSAFYESDTHSLSRLFQIDSLIEGMNVDRPLLIEGAPGSGKTTLLKWIALNCIRDPSSRFLLPIRVPLRDYAQRYSPEGDSKFFSYFMNRWEFLPRSEREALFGLFADLSNSTSRESEGRSVPLFLLDGWDEVPEAQKELVAQQIGDLQRQGFPVILSSRPVPSLRGFSGFAPYRIAYLSIRSSVELTERWLESMGSDKAQASELLAAIEKHPDLRPLIRVPFVLAALCSLAYKSVQVRAGRPIGEGLPRDRTDLYHQLIEAISSSAKPGGYGGIDDETLARAQELSLWLLKDAQDAPRFVFDTSTCRRVGFNEWQVAKLSESRLVTGLRSEVDGFEFLHASVQEFLAACALTSTESRQPSDHEIVEGFFRVALTNVWTFVAGLSRDGAAARIIWSALGKLVDDPDTYGLVYARLARMLASRGRVTDGGMTILGKNLCEPLWDTLRKIGDFDELLEALAVFDPAFLFQRIRSEREKTTPGRERYTLERMYRRALILAPDQHDGSVEDDFLTGNLFGVVSPGSERNLIDALNNPSDEDLDRLLSEGGAGWSRAVRYLGQSSTSKAARRLSGEVANRESVDELRDLITALGNSGHPLAHEALMALLATRDTMDRTALHILEALAYAPMRRGEELILNALRSGNTEIRERAATALTESHRDMVGETLSTIAVDTAEPSSLRIVCLRALEPQASASEVREVVRILTEEGAPTELRQAAVLVALRYARRHRSASPSSTWTQVRLIAERALRDRIPGLLAPVAANAHWFGDALAPALIDLLDDNDAGAEALSAASVSLGAILSQEAIAVPIRQHVVNRLSELAGRKQEEASESDVHDLRQAAIVALANVDAEALFALRGKLTYRDLSILAKRGYYVFKDRLRDPDGRLLVSPSPSPDTGSAPERNLLDLLVRQRPSVERLSFKDPKYIGRLRRLLGRNPGISSEDAGKALGGFSDATIRGQKVWKDHQKEQRRKKEHAKPVSTELESEEERIQTLVDVFCEYSIRELREILDGEVKQRSSFSKGDDALELLAKVGHELADVNKERAKIVLEFLKKVR